MQRVTLVRYTTKPGRADENEKLSSAVFDELRQAAPDNLTYMLFRNGNDFVHLFVNFAADDATQLTDLPAFQRFQKDIAGRCDVPPDALRLQGTMVDSYRLA